MLGSLTDSSSTINNCRVPVMKSRTPLAAAAAGEEAEALGEVQ